MERFLCGLFAGIHAGFPPGPLLYFWDSGSLSRNEANALLTWRRISGNKRECLGMYLRLNVGSRTS